MADADNSFHANWSPSGLPSYHDRDGSHTMSYQEIEANYRVTIVTPNELAVGLAKVGIAFSAIGDGVAARQAAYAIYEGRLAGLSLEEQ